MALPVLHVISVYLVAEKNCKMCAVLYGSECLAIEDLEIHKLNVAEMVMSRQLCSKISKRNGYIVRVLEVGKLRTK